MTRRPKSAPTSYRNGLKWREGRPRWEPSPASRRIGLSGLDLKGLSGEWLTLGAAIDAAEARKLWAAQIREAARNDLAGTDARAQLREVLNMMPSPRTDAERQARAIVSDLIAAALRIVGAPELTVIVNPDAVSTRKVNDLIDAFFEDETLIKGPFALAPETRRNYKSHAKMRIRAKLGDTIVTEVTRGALRAWYVDLYEETSPSTAYGTLSAVGAFFRWGLQHDWVTATPATQLGRISPEGRRVFWTVEEELSFIPWCDENGYEDVADGLVLGLWTGARSGDMCDATLYDLSGDDWRFLPNKTAKSNREALPGLLAPVKARVERRRESAKRDKVRGLNATPFLWDFRTQKPHTPATLAYRYREAKFLALLREAVPESLADKRIQDTRDTCITRLYEADVALDKIPAWTGHSPDDRDDILREHYIVLRSAGAAEAAAKLARWAAKNGLTVA